MRASGKTTRLVDEAIQTLFTEKIIVIPFNEQDTRGFLPQCIIVDEDSNYRGQRYLLKTILNRLKFEHRSDIREDIQIKDNIIRIV